jgi:hypothetical protein
MHAVGIALLSAAALWVAIDVSPWRRRKRQRVREQRALELARRREAADRALAQQWMDAVAYSQRYSRWDGYTRSGLAHVTQVYGAYPRRGTKAVLRWYGSSGAPDDAWFELAWPREGDWLMVSGGYGYGEHNRNPDTFYAFIGGVVPAGAWEAWQRQQRQLVAR